MGNHVLRLVVSSIASVSLQLPQKKLFSFYFILLFPIRRRVVVDKNNISNAMSIIKESAMVRIDSRFYQISNQSLIHKSTTTTAAE